MVQCVGLCAQEAELLHQDHKALKLRLELRYWRTEHDNLELQIKARLSLSVHTPHTLGLHTV